METYYLYINQDDLNRFLVENLIYPYTESLFAKASFSLQYTNCLFLTKKTFSKETIVKTCSSGLSEPIVLSVQIDLKRADIIFRNDTDILINNPISFSCVTKIHCVLGEMPGFVFRDLFVFDQLVDSELFGGGDDVLSEPIDLSNIEIRNLKGELEKWSKLQAFYCARFGYVSDEQWSKKKIVFKRNIDLDSFKYISDIPYESFIKKYYGIPQKPLIQLQIVPEETTFLNDNFNQILDSIGKVDEGENSEDFLKYKAIYSWLFALKGGDENISMPDHPLLKEEVKEAEKLIQGDATNISFLMSYFEKAGNRLLMTLFILFKILRCDIETARAYIGNFTDKSEFQKELLSMYGLGKGMPSITIDLKKRPDLLLFAFNMSKAHFTTYVDSNPDYISYFQARGYKPDCLMPTGFDFKVFDESAERNYVDRHLINRLVAEYGITTKNLPKKIIKYANSKQLHEIFKKIKTLEGEDASND